MTSKSTFIGIYVIRNTKTNILTKKKFACIICVHSSQCEEDYHKLCQEDRKYNPFALVLYITYSKVKQVVIPNLAKLVPRE